MKQAPAEPTPALDPASLVGTTLAGKYRLLELLGQGGMGFVFRAQRLATGQTVAVKLLRAEFSHSPQIVSRFEREAEVMARLSHPHIVQIVEFGDASGHLFLAMELLQGRSLADLIEEKRRLSVKRTVAVMRQVLTALQHAHALGVVHRDLKPENIMLVQTGGLFSRERVKLLDYGVAKVADEAGPRGEKLTQPGFALGTPEYMSPEQAVGDTADARSDVYACGIILYEMLTGRRPFDADSVVEVLGMQLNTAPSPLRAVVPDARISANVEAVVLRALAKRPEDRFQTASELHEALEHAATAPDARIRMSGLETTIVALPNAPPLKRRRMRIGAVVFGVVTASVIIAEHHLPTANDGRSATRETNGNARKSPNSEAVRPAAKTKPRKR